MNNNQPNAQPVLYFDHAATSWPKPDCVIEAMTQCMREFGASPGRSGHRMAMRADEVVFDCRANLARLFNIANPLCISFTCNATEAINLALKGLLRPGDHAILSPLEHNAVFRPLKHLELAGVRLSVARGDLQGRASAESIEREITPATRLIVASHASNVTGAIQPIDAIGRLARARGIPFMVDAAQTAGHLPMDVEAMGIDLLAFPGHKGLLGPQGTGGLYAREDLRLKPLKEGGTGSVSESPYQPDFIPDRYESGTLNLPGIAGLNAAVNHLLGQGIEAIRAAEQRLLGALDGIMRAMPALEFYGPSDPAERAGIAAFNLRGQDCNAVCEALDHDFGIAARGGLHCAWLAHKTVGTLATGAVRLSVGASSALDQIDEVGRALKSLSQSARRPCLQGAET